MQGHQVLLKGEAVREESKEEEAVYKDIITQR